MEAKCRYCLCDVDLETEKGKIVAPCKCKTYVHLQCFKDWVTASKQNHISSCEICLSPYEYRYLYENPMLDWTQITVNILRIILVIISIIWPFGKLSDCWHVAKLIINWANKTEVFFLAICFYIYLTHYLIIAIHFISHINNYGLFMTNQQSRFLNYELTPFRIFDKIILMSEYELYLLGSSWRILLTVLAHIIPSYYYRGFEGERTLLYEVVVHQPFTIWTSCYGDMILQLIFIVMDHTNSCLRFVSDFSKDKIKFKNIWLSIKLMFTTFMYRDQSDNLYFDYVLVNRSSL